MFNHKFLVIAVVLASFAYGPFTAVIAGGRNDKAPVTFTVRVENTAAKEGVVASDGSRYPFALSPGFYLVTNRRTELFRAGKRAGKAIEALAEDGNPELFLNELIGRVTSSFRSGIFNKPVGSQMASPILPGGVFEFTIVAQPGMKLNLVTMYGQSNDLFYAPDSSIDLFDKVGEPISGDITDLFKLWDAGTEINQAPGLGADQGPRQSSPNTGAEEKGIVRLVDDGFTYPEINEVLRVSITAK